MKGSHLKTESELNSHSSLSRCLHKKKIQYFIKREKETQSMKTLMEISIFHNLHLICAALSIIPVG